MSISVKELRYDGVMKLPEWEDLTIEQFERSLRHHSFNALGSFGQQYCQGQDSEMFVVAGESNPPLMILLEEDCSGLSFKQLKQQMLEVLMPIVNPKIKRVCHDTNR